MAAWKSKNCPQCYGQLCIQREKEVWYEVCQSCGYHRDISNLVTENTVGQVKIKCPTEVSF